MMMVNNDIDEGDGGMPAHKHHPYPHTGTYEDLMYSGFIPETAAWTVH